MLGALYVSDDFFEAGVGIFFENVYKPFIEAHVRLQTLSGNPKTTLLEFLQAEGCMNNSVGKRPAEKQNQPVHMEGKCCGDCADRCTSTDVAFALVVVHGQVIASAVDPSNTIATRRAALAALDFLANNPDFLSRTCNCKTSAAEQKKAPAKTETEPTPKKKNEEEASEAEVEDLMDAEEEV